LCRWEIDFHEVPKAAVERDVVVAADIDAVGLLRRVSLEVLHVDVDVQDQVGDLLDLARNGYIGSELLGILLRAFSDWGS
jgi:hypothetical protein